MTIDKLIKKYMKKKPIKIMKENWQEWEYFIPKYKFQDKWVGIEKGYSVFIHTHYSTKEKDFVLYKKRPKKHCKCATGNWDIYNSPAEAMAYEGTLNGTRWDPR